jgi:hypothetical protein
MKNGAFMTQIPDDGDGKGEQAPGPDPGAGQLIRDRKACVTMDLI